jgi:hypothetical protein
VLDLGFAEGVACWELDGEGCWHRRAGEGLRDIQVELMRRRAPKADA